MSPQFYGTLAQFGQAFFCLFPEYTANWAAIKKYCRSDDNSAKPPSALTRLIPHVQHAVPDDVSLPLSRQQNSSCSHKPPCLPDCLISIVTSLCWLVAESSWSWERSSLPGVPYVGSVRLDLKLIHDHIFNFNWLGFEREKGVLICRN